MTYGELDERSNRLAHALSERFGLEHGDRVALLVHNRMEVVEVLAASAKADVVYVGLNFRMEESDLDAVFQNAEPRLLIAEQAYSAMAQKLGACYAIPVMSLDDSSADGYEAVLASAAARLPEAAHCVRPEF